MRVLILEDDPWIADLLQQIVLSLRPGIQVRCLGRVADALLDWHQHAADLVIADWNLPDGSGVELLQAIRKQDRALPLVMITGRVDRASVLEVRPLGISAFIAKPFQVPRVVECLEALLPTLAPPAATAVDEDPGDFLAHLAALPTSRLDLPLQQGLRDKLQQSLKGTQLNLRELAEGWQQDPALSARLIAVANSSAYNAAGRRCVSLVEALQKLGAPTSLNLAIGLALRQSSAISSPQLRLLAQAYMDKTERLVERVAALAAACKLDPASCQSAALLHRMGELCVLYLAQAWEDNGHALEEFQVTQALDQFSQPFAVALKANWQLPMALRDLIGAVYALPQAQVRREQVLMRLACAELEGEELSSLERLRRLLGLS
ncbi:MAG: HDOD domain-containing protein [Pseudomonadota bacterium]